MKCPNCTEEMEKMMPYFYRCGQCPEMFMIFAGKQIESIGSMVTNLPESFQNAGKDMYEKISKDDGS